MLQQFEGYYYEDTTGEAWKDFVINEGSDMPTKPQKNVTCGVGMFYYEVYQTQPDPDNMETGKVSVQVSPWGFPKEITMQGCMTYVSPYLPADIKWSYEEEPPGMAPYTKPMMDLVCKNGDGATVTRQMGLICNNMMRTIGIDSTTEKLTNDFAAVGKSIADDIMYEFSQKAAA